MYHPFFLTTKTTEFLHRDARSYSLWSLCFLSLCALWFCFAQNAAVRDTTNDDSTN